MVEHVVGSGQECAPSTSPVRRCSLPVPAELQVDAACQRRDVAAASVAPAGTTALAGVTAEKGARVCRTLWLVGLTNYFWGSWREGPGGLERIREDTRAVRVDANLAQIWAKDGSDRTRRSECVASLGRTLAMRRSGRTRPAGDALRGGASVTESFGAKPRPEAHAGKNALIIL
jgi:hypothetical protein